MISRNKRNTPLGSVNLLRSQSLSVTANDAILMEKTTCVRPDLSRTYRIKFLRSVDCVYKTSLRLSWCLTQIVQCLVTSSSIAAAIFSMPIFLMSISHHFIDFCRKHVSSVSFCVGLHWLHYLMLSQVKKQP